MQILKDVLPNNTPIGYASDVFAHNGKAAYYLLAQYVLSPVIIEDSIEPEYLIGDFFSEVRLQEFCNEHNAIVSQQFSQGVCLIKRQ
jgi:hypothetical protein